VKIIMAACVFGIGAYAGQMSVSAGMEIMMAAVIMAIVD
jgi:hypothetical protein